MTRPSSYGGQTHSTCVCSSTVHGYTISIWLSPTVILIIYTLFNYSVVNNIIIYVCCDIWRINKINDSYENVKLYNCMIGGYYDMEVKFMKYIHVHVPLYHVHVSTYCIYMFSRSTCRSVYYIRALHVAAAMIAGRP